MAINSTAGFSAFTSISIIGGSSDDTLTLADNLNLDLHNGTIDGGAGTDTLRLVSDSYSGYFDLWHLAAFTGIEIIRGSSDSDTIWIRDDQLAGVETIDGGVNTFGGENILGLRGTNLDLRPRKILNFDRISVVTDNAVVTLSDKVLALKVTGYGAQDDHLVLVGDTFTESELQLLHSRGVDKITYANGQTSINEAPEIANLDGEAIRTVAGRTVVLDSGADATITDDDGVVSSLTFRIRENVLQNESIGIDTSGSVELSDGLFDDSIISVDNTEIGVIRDTSGSGFSVYLLNGATPDLVNKLIRALTYVNTSTDATFAAHRNIMITAYDDGERRGTATVGVTIAQPNVLVLSSRIDNLNGTAADETIVAGLRDMNAGDSLDGGAGFDTLKFSALGIEPWDHPYYDFTVLGGFAGIEKLQGSSAEETFALNASSLASLSILEGGEPSSWILGDSLKLHGGSLDLRNKTISGFETIWFADSSATLMITDASLAEVLRVYGSQKINVILEGKTFTDYERNVLLSKGVSTVSDASGTYTTPGYNPPPLPQIENPINGTPGADTLVGLAGPDRILGLDGNDRLYGGLGHDTIEGGTGNDRLWGELGNDTLIGNKGKDVFVFNTKASNTTNWDRVMDFNVKDDSIWLENKVFTKLGKSGTATKPAQLKKDYFTIGSKAKDKNDYVIYDHKNGKLSYDADGSGKVKAVEIVTLPTRLAVTHKDFFVI